MCPQTTAAELTLKLQIDDTFKAKQRTICSCPSVFSSLNSDFHCSVIPSGWTLTFQFITVKIPTYMGLKIDLHKRNKKNFIYNKYVFENTKITSVTFVMLTNWHIYMQEKSSNSVIWAAEACIFLIWWTHCRWVFTLTDVLYSKYLIY